MKGSTRLGCAFQDYHPRKSILRELGMLGSKHTVKFSKGIWYQIKIWERKSPARGVIQKCAPHERSLCAPKFEDRSHEETLTPERCARRAAWDLAKILTSSRIRTELRFYVPGEVIGMSTLITSKRPEELLFVVDSGASMHMMTKKKLISEELWTVERSKTQKVHPHEEAQVFVHDLNEFVTVQLLKLCKDHAYSCEWVSGQEPR